MPKKPEPVILAAAIVIQDERFAKEDIGVQVITDLMQSNLVTEIIEGRDRVDVLMIIPSRRSSKDAILAIIRNTLDHLGV